MQLMSVSAKALIFKEMARSTKASIAGIPFRNENWEWTWRWTKLPDIGVSILLHICADKIIQKYSRRQ